MFDSVNAKNAVDMFAAQLLAAKLNRRAGVPGCPALGAAVTDAEQRIENPAAFSRGQINAVKDILDAYNNGNLCP